MSKKRAIGEFAVASSDSLVGRPQNRKRAAAALVYHVVRPQIADPHAFNIFFKRSEFSDLYLEINSLSTFFDSRLLSF